MSDENPRNKLVGTSEWERVRKSLLGRWKENPESCCNQLRIFMGNVSYTSNDKIRVVMNYLTSTGFRTGRIKHPCITKLRSQMSSEIKIRKARKEW